MACMPDMAFAIDQPRGRQNAEWRGDCAGVSESSYKNVRWLSGLLVVCMKNLPTGAKQRGKQISCSASPEYSLFLHVLREWKTQIPLSVGLTFL